MELDAVQLRTTYGVTDIMQPVVHLTNLLGVPVYGAADWKLLPAAIAGVGIVVAEVIGPGRGILGKAVVGLAYGAMLAGAAAVHQIGHISSGQAIDAEMDAIVLKVPRPAQLYEHRGASVPMDVHRIRAAGGPMGNLAVGLFARGISRKTGGRIGKATAFINLAFALGSLIPIAGNDGEVLWLGKVD
jgi:hypothetical protein